MNKSFINSVKSAVAIKKEAQMYGELNLALLHAKIYPLKAVLSGAGRLYLCVAAEEAVILMIDEYRGDELANEEPLHGESPLYYSETSSRVSPVFRLWAVTLELKKHLEGKVKQFASVMLTTSNIINEPDIENIWKNIRVHVRKVKAFTGLSITADRTPKFVRTFTDIYSAEETVESHVDMEEYRNAVSGTLQPFIDEDDSESVHRDVQPLFVEVDVESIIDKDDPVYHCVQPDGTSSYLRSNLPPVKVYAPITNPDAVLENMVGLDDVKSHVRRITNLSLFRKKLENKNIHVKLPTISLHTCFVGNPGTGKSTVAVLFASLLHAAGVLSSGNVIIANRASFLGRWVGSEERNVAMLLEMSKGSVLMIDEAHNLLLGANPSDYSRNVMPIMMTALADETNRDFAVLLCGYEKEMDEAMATDPGIRSRFPNRFVFEDYNVEQLYEMAVGRIAGGGYILEDTASEKLHDILQLMYDHRDPANWANAREVSTLWENIMIRHAERCILQGVSVNKALITITSDDIPEYKPVAIKPRTKIGFC